MGRVNAELIRAAERARRAHGEGSEEWRRAAALVDESQEACPHPAEARFARAATIDSPSGRIRVGDQIVGCRECSALLTVNGRPWERKP